LGKMGEVAKEGRAILLASHNMKSVSSLAQNCIWLDGGIIVSSGNCVHVINQYIKQMNTLISGGGWADLSNVERDISLASRRAQFNWVRLLDSTNNQSGDFRETEPITIELGFRVWERLRAFQFGCSFLTLDGNTELFTVPSPQYVRTLTPGTYMVRMKLEPNYLRQGDYIIAVKMFSGGLRQDTIGPVIKLTIQPFLYSDDNPAYGYGWVSGSMRYECNWGEIEDEKTLN
jgi:hypothetical protein